ncbi:SAV_2336 N-terminal domain-related protein [Streptomyces sp. NPDC001941]|uniref:SAV_2336 N-terminal domain-related protein n=1 Tax=Streptomyces sp. NPDC001941 TaxID=3154659 RepID=UPI00333320B7
MTGARTGTGAAAVRVPGVRGLAHQLGVARGLRPLKRTVPSPHAVELDEAATAEAIADHGLLDLVLRPARERWLDLVVAVDDGLSMRIWSDTVGELARLLSSLGIFRKVTVRAYAFAAPPPPARPAGRGRTVVLALSDATAPCWRDGTARRHLARWAREAPTALVNPLPARLWGGTGLDVEFGTVRTDRSAPANTGLRTPLARLPVPVLELAEWDLGPWARLLASEGAAARLAVADAAAGATTHPPPDAPDAREPDDRLRDFRAAVSPEAYALAGHLAAVDPLTLPVMRVVQAAVLPGSGPACLSEVLLGGLMAVDRPLGEEGGRGRAYDVFSFDPEVRELLALTIRPGAARRTVDAVSEFIEPRLGRAADFPALIADRTGSLRLPRGARPFGELAAEAEAEPEPSEVRLPDPDALKAGHGVHNLAEPLDGEHHARALRWLASAAEGGRGLFLLSGPRQSLKSKTAFHYAHTTAHRLTWWVRADTPRALADGLAGLAARLVPAAPPGGPPDRDALVRWALDWLAAHRGWLLVLDGLTELGQLLELGLDAPETGTVLVTTRVRAHEHWPEATYALGPEEEALAEACALVRGQNRYAYEILGVLAWYGPVVPAPLLEWMTGSTGVVRAAVRLLVESGAVAASGDDGLRTSAQLRVMMRAPDPPHWTAQNVTVARGTAVRMLLDEVPEAARALTEAIEVGVLAGALEPYESHVRALAAAVPPAEDSVELAILYFGSGLRMVWRDGSPEGVRLAERACDALDVHWGSRSQERAVLADNALTRLATAVALSARTLATAPEGTPRLVELLREQRYGEAYGQCVRVLGADHPLTAALVAPFAP